MEFIKRNKSKMSYGIYFLDLETTGLLKHNGRIVEIACCKVIYKTNGDQRTGKICFLNRSS